MSKKIRRNRSKMKLMTHLDPLGILSKDFLKSISNFGRQQQEEIIAVTSMPYFCKHKFGRDLNAYKSEAATSKSIRRTILGGRRSGKTDFIVFDALYHALTSTHQRIVIAAPTKEHIQDIFRRMREAIQSNNDLESQLTRDVSAPYAHMQFSNGSRIRGFCIGRRNTMRGVGVSLCGQDADHIYIEEFSECNYNAITGSVYPILQVIPDCSLTMIGIPPSLTDEGWDLESLNDIFRWATPEPNNEGLIPDREERPVVYGT